VIRFGLFGHDHKE
jgi:hypothetical protein